MNADAFMFADLVKECLMKHSADGGIDRDEIRKEIPDIDNETLEKIIGEMLFSGQIEESDGKLILINPF